MPLEVREILDAEVRRAARVRNLLRMVLGATAVLAVVANWGSNRPEALWTAIATAVAYAALAGLLYMALRRGFWRDWVPFAGITADVTGVTVLSLTGLANFSGAYEVLLAPVFPLCYLLVNLLTISTYSVAASVYAAVLAAIQRAGVLSWVLAHDLVVVSPAAVYGEKAVGMADQITIVFFVLVSGIVPAWGSHRARQLLVQSAEATVQALQAERERAHLRKYLSGNVLEYVLSNPDAMGLGGVRRMATVLFVDIRHFTPLTERLPPERVVEFLNRVFGEMVGAVFEHGGTLDKFTGDGLMAVFGVPREVPDAPLHALRAALQMQARLRNVPRPDGEALKIGIGIAHGVVVAGNLGTAERMEYTCVGDTVNLAARLQEMTRDLGLEILANEAVADAGRGHVRARRLPALHVRGRAEEVPVWSIDGASQP
jgi:class 3 adenylate cyclase